MNRSRHTLFRVLSSMCMLALLAACNSVAWKRVESPSLKSRDKSFEVQVPSGWMHLDGATDGVLVSRDGLAMQFVRVQRPAHDKAFADIKKTSSADMLPNELGELIVASRHAWPGMTSLTVKQNEPATFSGMDGVQVRMSYRNERGASFDQLVFAAAEEKTVLLFEYQALSRVYFDRDLPVFQSIMGSFKDLSAGRTTPK